MNKKSLLKADLFREISELNNYCDEKLVEGVYYGMVKVFIKHLKAGEEVRMPDWGKFFIKIRPPRQVRNVADGEIINVKPKKMVKFASTEKARKYFESLE